MKRILDLVYFVAKDLLSDGWRTLLTIINLLVFMCCFFALISLAEAATKFANQPTDRSALLIIERNVLDPSESVVTETEFIPAEEMIPTYVTSVTPLIFKIVKVDDRLLQLRAARVFDMQNVQSLQLISGNWPVGLNEIVVGESTTSLTGWKIGDRVTIYGSEFKIVGIIRAPGTKFSSIWMDLKSAEQLFNIEGKYQFAWIQLQPGTDGEYVQTLLNTDARLNKKFDVYFADNLYQNYAKAISEMGSISTLLVLLALSMVMLGTYCNIFLILSERNREIAILRAIGFKSLTLRSLITFRSSLQIIAAYIISWILSSLLLNYLNKVNPLTLHSIPLEVEISLFGFIVGLVLSLIFSWLGVWIPTRFLQRQAVVEILQK